MTSNIIKDEHTNNDKLYEKIKTLDDKIQKYKNKKIFNKLFNFIKFFNTIYNYKFIILNFIILFINIYILYFNKAYSYKIRSGTTLYNSDIYTLQPLEESGFNQKVEEHAKIAGFCSVFMGGPAQWHFLWTGI